MTMDSPVLNRFVFWRCDAAPRLLWRRGRELLMSYWRSINYAKIGSVEPSTIICVCRKSNPRKYVPFHSGNEKNRYWGSNYTPKRYSGVCRLSRWIVSRKYQTAWQLLGNGGDAGRMGHLQCMVEIVSQRLRFVPERCMRVSFGILSYRQRFAFLDISLASINDIPNVHNVVRVIYEYSPPGSSPENDD